ncbi:endoglucanase 2 [Sporothrix brasiliensis 5110]|uniref:cellulase n=1 Tax=Sporothrix brasiliensis 5110 TaxID=1398154 RepID=A0A0C2IIK0_9PEZI|nr:endoglucanase 2 [Sporothrix brasiliensis 5110]KIH86820.1 endoglucanase 2 [Sporothrix brasiliensis 5110]
MLSLSYFPSLVLLGFLAYAQAAVQFLGVAMAGGDFGCDIDGSCPLSTATLPLTELGHADGGGQMKHFVEDDGVNMFRLPTSWQFLINNDKEVSDTFDPTNAGRYDQFVKACLATGAYCMIDVHNFARFNGGIVGQGGPSDDMFVAIWAALAKMYADEPKVVFEITNEPHDLDLETWAATCQKVVNGIRNAGAKTQMILLPGTNFDSAATLISTGSADALLAITNPDGSTDGLYLDIHKYLDNNNSGQNAECTTNNIGNFTMLATYLRQKKRQGLISETGASSEPSCMTDFCAQNAFINENADVYIGYVSWAAGQFDETYVLSLTPTLQPDGSYKDNTLFSECVLAPYQKAGGAKGKALPSNTAAQPSSTSKATQTKASNSAKPSATAATPPSSSNSDTGSDAGAKGGSLAATTTTSASTSASTNAASVGRAVDVIKNLAVAAVVGAALL